MPSKNTMRRCWNANPQGAGYMVSDPSTRMVIGKKGFMKFDDFMKELSDPKLDKMNVVIHFRIATHGGVNEKATHPFPVSDKTDDLNALAWTCRAGIAHNGIIPGYGSQKGLSDTQEWIKKIASSAGEHILHPGVLKVLESSMGASRLVIMRRDKVIRLGSGWVLFKGCWYSNSGYKKPKIVYYNAQDWANDTKVRNDYWKKQTERGWPGFNKKPATEVKQLPVIQTTIPTTNKPVAPIKADSAGYGSRNDNYHKWCDGQCLTCAYNEKGICIIDVE